MSELPPTQTPSEPLAYQPISGWAIGGFATGCLFTLLVAISAGFALFQGAPFFFPVWTIGLALLGMGLSHIGERHVQTSEGTRAGTSLARWGFRLSLVSGLVYFTYYYVTGMVIQNQANAFVMELGEDAGFMPHLQKSSDPVELNTAFLLAQAPSARGSARPDNELSMRAAFDRPNKEGGSGMLTTFREGIGPIGSPARDSLPRILSNQLGKDAVITPMGVLDWAYDKRSYKVYRVYRIKTKELEVDYTIAALSMEAEGAGQSRKWFVNLVESGPVSNSQKLTPTGEGLVNLRQTATHWLFERFKALSEEKKGFAKVAQLDRTPWDVLQIDNGTAAERNDRRSQIHKILSGASEVDFQRFEVLTQRDQAGRWEQVDGKIRLYLMTRMALSKQKNQLPMYPFDVLVTLESTQAIDPAKFGPADKADWNLISFEVTATMVVNAPKQGEGAGALPTRSK